MFSFTLPLSITIGDHEAEWETEVFYEYYPPTRGQMRGEPDEPGYCRVGAVLGQRFVHGATAGRAVPDGEPVELRAVLSPLQMTTLEELALREYERAAEPNVEAIIESKEAA